MSPKVEKLLMCPKCGERLKGKFGITSYAEYMYIDTYDYNGKEDKSVAFSDLYHPIDADISSNDLFDIYCTGHDCGWSLREELGVERVREKDVLEFFKEQNDYQI
jgi:hypothetical protein